MSIKFHDQRRVRPGTGALPPLTGRTTDTCTVPGCGRPVRAKGLCKGHHTRWQRHGDFFPDIPIGTSNNVLGNQPPQYAECPPIVVRHAACKGAGDIMFVERGESHIVARARAICATCPVREPCLEWALTEPDPCAGGVAGGKTTRERGAIRNQRRRVA